MLKYKNIVLTREELNTAKKLHSDSYNQYITDKQNLFNSNFGKGYTEETRFKMIQAEVLKPKTMKQCIKIVQTKGE